MRKNCKHLTAKLRSGQLFCTQCNVPVYEIGRGPDRHFEAMGLPCTLKEALDIIMQLGVQDKPALTRLKQLVAEDLSVQYYENHNEGLVDLLLGGCPPMKLDEVYSFLSNYNSKEDLTTMLIAELTNAI